MNRVAGEGKLRDDYTAQIKPYIAAREGYQKVVAAAQDMTPAGSIALVFGYMKTLDPTSTVREGEQATVQNSGTIPQTIQNMYNKLLGGTGTLSPEQRAQFAASAKGQFEVYDKTYQALNQRYGQLATSYGYDPANVVQSFEPIAPYEPPKAPPKVSEGTQAAYQTLMQRGGIDRSKPLGDKAHPFIADDPATMQGLDRPENKGKWVLYRGQFGVIE